MENSEYSSIIGNAAAPYINSLATQYGVGSQYYAIMHPSLPNYLALTGGSNFGITTDCNSCTVDATNLADQVEASGRTWRAYMESMPSPCYLSDSGTYALHHDPWVYYNDIRTNPTRCAADVVPYTQLATDLSGSAVPNLVWITPNTCNDMHNCSITTGDTWLSQNVPVIVNSPAFQNGGVLFIVWDEGTTSNGCCAGAAGGKVAVLVVSPRSIPGYTSTTPETHYSLLGTIEDAWGLSRLNNAACTCAPAMREYFH